MFFSFFSKELDHLDSRERYGDLFSVMLDVVVSPKDRPVNPSSAPWESITRKALTPELLFLESDEHEEVMKNFKKSKFNSSSDMHHLFELTEP